MKKLIMVFIASIALTSCFSNTDDTTINEIPVNDNSTGSINIIEDENEMNSEENTDIIENSTGSINIIEDENTDLINIDTKISEEGEVSDESILEDEVNDLLDEFIDSLDSYDK